MSKRARGARRPGQRRPIQRTGARPVASAPSAGATIGPRVVEPATPAFPDEAVEVSAGRTEAGMPRSRSRSTSGVFAASAAQEYGYVVSDVRRISVVGGTLFLLMLALFVAIEVAHVVRI